MSENDEYQYPYAGSSRTFSIYQTIGACQPDDNIIRFQWMEEGAKQQLLDRIEALERELTETRAQLIDMTHKRDAAIDALALVVKAVGRE